MVWEVEWVLYVCEVCWLYEKLFYRPLFEVVARVLSEGLRLMFKEVGCWLVVFGFGDLDGVLCHIEVFIAGLL